jgi:Holliday junction DNA helicase RuvA
MITCLTGTIKEIKDQNLTIDVHGVGFAVSLARTENFKKDDTISLHIYMHWNQESGPALFGFATELERSLFLVVTACSGIGPKIALAVLKHMQPNVFIKAVQIGDEKALSAVPGIGAKKAEQMIVQLRHKVEKLLESGIVIDQDVTLGHWSTISDVLNSLHYSRNEISAALAYIKESELNQSATFDQLLRQALSFLSKRIV